MAETKSSSNPIKVLVAWPRAGFTMTEAVDNQIDLAAHMGRLNERGEFLFYFATIGRLFVAKAREEFARYALEMGCDYLLMIDDDMLVPHDLFESLYKHDVDIVAPLAFQRRHPFFPVIYKMHKGWDSVRKEAFFSNEIVKNYPKDTLFECEAVGFGAVLIKRWVLEKMVEPRFMSTSPTGEDILFCYNARENIGARVFVDTATKIAHLGSPRIIQEEDYEKENNIDAVRDVHGDCKDEYYEKVNL